MARTVERIQPGSFRNKEEYLLHLRHLAAYEFVAAQVQGAGRVLEVGCGEGYGTHRLASEAGEMVGVDVDEETVRHAQARYGSATCHFQPYDGAHLPFEQASFDAVVSLQVIEHVEDVGQYLREIRRVLRLGALFVCATPNRNHRLQPGQPPWNPFHLREYDPGQFETALAAVFPRVEVRGLHGSKDINDVERSRVQRGLSLRKLLPDFARNLLDGDYTRRYSPADFAVTDDAETALDLVALCRA